MTVVIFAKNYSKFDIPFEDLYKNRNITVKGMIETYWIFRSNRPPLSSGKGWSV